MARKDELLREFLKHELIADKYGIKADELPRNMLEAREHDEPIVRVIAMYIDGMEDGVTPKSLREQILQYLNQANTNI